MIRPKSKTTRSKDASFFLEKPGVADWEKSALKSGRPEKWPFYSDTASDFLMVKFIKVITSLKSQQEKQIWTY